MIIFELAEEITEIKHIIKMQSDELQRLYDIEEKYNKLLNQNDLNKCKTFDKNLSDLYVEDKHGLKNFCSHRDEWWESIWSCYDTCHKCGEKIRPSKNADKYTNDVIEENLGYINFYEHCDKSWKVKDADICNSQCPICKKEIEPYESNLTYMGEDFEIEEDYDYNVYYCSMCKKTILLDKAHLHNGLFIGDCCWDERLKTTE